MTTREFLTAISDNATLSAELHDKAVALIAALDKRNEQRAAKPSKTAQANEPVKANIATYLTDHAGALASDIAVALGISTPKVSALCRQMSDSGIVRIDRVKVPKRGTLCAYTLIKSE